MKSGISAIQMAPGPADQLPGVTSGPELVRRHFRLQDLRPPELGDVDPADMDPFMRGLLFTDGTVTRTLEVNSLSRVCVRVIGQTTMPLDERAAAGLRTPTGSDAIRRRVVIGPEGAAPAVWAESHILPERLPAAFLAVLGGARDGIGQSLQAVELESWREMLWFGLAGPPIWSFTAPQARSPLITRCYRVIAAGSPALLITESFAVQEREGVFHLRWSA